MSVKKRSVAEKTAQLDELVSWFDSDEFELEKALDKFKEAEKLAAEIEADLMELKNEVTVIKKRFDETN
jgi:exodeoxyribonuclease VII small subunit